MRGATIAVTLGFAVGATPMCSAADFYFDVKDSACFVVVSNAWAMIQFDTVYGLLSGEEFLEAHTCLNDTLPPEDHGRGFWKYALSSGWAFSAAASDLRADPLVARVFPVYTPDGGAGDLVVTDVVYVAFDPDVPFDSCVAVVSDYGLLPIDTLGFDRLTLVCAIPDTESTGPLDYGNALQVLPEVRWSSPAFHTGWQFGSLPEVPYFQYQYYLHNTGQFGGDAGVDLQVDSAWMIPYTDNAVVVAVIDDGVEPHEDLPASRLLSGWDFVGPDYSLYGYLEDSTASPGPARYHGMAIAGIIGAAHNGVGVAGIAPACLIVPVKISDDLGTIPSGKCLSGGGCAGDTMIAKAVRFAADAQAEVISCSWESRTTSVIPVVQSAILYGLDCNVQNDIPSVFVFIAGNRAEDWDYAIRFPANMPEVIAVGAVDKHGERWNYSGFGASLAVMAPSGDDNSVPWRQGDQWTLDRMYNYGWNPAPPEEFPDPCPDVNYTGRMGGTSGAVPQVSGIIAMLLARRPELRQAPETGCNEYWPGLASEIITHTATDIGPIGWDSLTGHGIANAFHAVLSISRGDFNNDGAIDVLDVVRCVNIAFRGGAVADNAWHPAV